MNIPPLIIGRRYDDQLPDMGKRKSLLRKAIASAAKAQGIKLDLSVGEETLAGHLNAEKIPYEREFRFHPVREWRADFRLLNTNILIEVEGGGQNGEPGRHQRRDGFERDCQKYNAAAIAGWRVLRYTTELVRNGLAIAQITQIAGVK